SAPHAHPNQFALLGQRRFAPFFWTQFLGAGNDNLFKFAFTVLITYQLQVQWLPPSLAGLVIGALFILPFLLFSATSGQLADKFDKARLIRFVKWLEIAIMALAAWGFLHADVFVLLAPGDLVVFRSLLGRSWMWFFGAAFLAQFPAFATEVLHGDEQVASLLLVVFSIGIGIGSLLCEVLSRRHVEIGLVPLGALGMSVFAVDLYFAARGLPPADGLALAQFLGTSAHWRVMADLALLSLFAGLYSVP